MAGDEDLAEQREDLRKQRMTAGEAAFGGKSMEKSPLVWNKK